MVFLNKPPRNVAEIEKKPHLGTASAHTMLKYNSLYVEGLFFAEGGGGLFFSGF